VASQSHYVVFAFEVVAVGDDFAANAVVFNVIPAGIPHMASVFDPKSTVPVV